MGNLENRKEQDTERPELSVVIPVWNDAENLGELHARLTEVLQALGKAYEMVFVDDGSTDGTFEGLKRLHQADPCHVKVIRFRRNFGQHAALSAGLEYAAGDVMVTMDADLQNAPEDIPTLVAKIEEGHDLVSGWRMSKRESLFTRRVPSYLLNGLVRSMTGIKLHDYTCPLNAVRRSIVREMTGYGELRRFLKPLAAQLAGSIAEVKVSHYPRRRGQSKYRISTLAELGLDFIISFSTRPFQMVAVLGIVLFGLGGIGGGLYLFWRFVLHTPPNDRVLVLLFLSVFFGLQFIIIGLLGEFVIRLFRIVQHRPFFVIDQVIQRENGDE